MQWRSILVGQPRNRKYRSWKLPLKGVSSLQWKCKSSDYDVEMMKWTSCIHFLPFSCWTVESILKHIFCITTFFIVLQEKTIGCCFGMLKVCHRDVKVVLKHVYSSCRVNNLSYFLFKMVWATLVQIEDQNPVSSAKHKCVTCSVLDWLAMICLMLFCSELIWCRPVVLAGWGLCEVPHVTGSVPSVKWWGCDWAWLLGTVLHPLQPLHFSLQLGRVWPHFQGRTLPLHTWIVGSHTHHKSGNPSAGRFQGHFFLSQQDFYSSYQKSVIPTKGWQTFSERGQAFLHVCPARGAAVS